MKEDFLESDSEWKREAIAEYQSDSACEGCNGNRLKEEALCVKIDNQNISEVTKKSILDAAKWFKNLEQNLDKRQFKIAEHILKEINERLTFLLKCWLEYLTLSRESGTLSGGEAQRIRLASQIGSGLTGVLYVLDEPSIGLHQKDNVKLINALKRLRDLGNTVTDNRGDFTARNRQVHSAQRFNCPEGDAQVNCFQHQRSLRPLRDKQQVLQGSCELVQVCRKR